jgi:hypothetical protein
MKTKAVHEMEDQESGRYKLTQFSGAAALFPFGAMPGMFSTDLRIFIGPLKFNTLQYSVRPSSSPSSVPEYTLLY